MEAEWTNSDALTMGQITQSNNFNALNALECVGTPTADVVERKRGMWTERKVFEDGKAIEEWQSARCSVCGKYHTTPYMYYFNDFAYCPNCGAQMEGEEDES